MNFIVNRDTVELERELKAAGMTGRVIGIEPDDTWTYLYVIQYTSGSLNLLGRGLLTARYWLRRKIVRRDMYKNEMGDK